MNKPRLLAMLALVALAACAESVPTAVEPELKPSQNGLVLGSGNYSDTTSTPAARDAGGGLVLGSGN